MSSRRRASRRARRPVRRPVLEPLQGLAATGLGLFSEQEQEQGAALRAARAWLGAGETSAGRVGRMEPAPYAAVAAVFPLAFVLWRRDP